jgi:hypothetical protein
LTERNIAAILLIVDWCNGSTGVFDTLSSGSNPESTSNLIK